MPDPIHFHLRLECTPDSSPEEVHRLTEQLYRELSQTPVEQINWVQEELTDGTKGGTALTPELIVALSVGILPNLILFLQNWLLRQQSQVVKIKLPDFEIEMPRDMSPEDVSAIVERLKKSLSQSDSDDK